MINDYWQVSEYLEKGDATGLNSIFFNALTPLAHTAPIQTNIFFLSMYANHVHEMIYPYVWIHLHL